MLLTHDAELGQCDGGRLISPSLSDEFRGRGKRTLRCACAGSPRGERLGGLEGGTSARLC